MPTQAPDYEPRLRELRSTDFPPYFHEHEGALFHSHGDSPYPLPVHGPEWNRLNVQHSILHQLHPEPQYIGVVRGALAPGPEAKLAIDLCTGTGKWAMEMARAFPQAWFRGIDIVPIATRRPLVNVQFELQDVNATPYRWGPGTVDLIHARDIALAVENYTKILEEVARILRPGGLFVSVEWGMRPAGVSPSTGALVHAPSMAHFFDIVKSNLAARRGLQAFEQNTVRDLILQNQDFSGPVTETIQVPIGSWPADEDMQRFGRAFRAAHRYFAAAITPFLSEAVDPVDLNIAIQAHVHEMMTIDGLVTEYYATYARRI
ncbi:S-adenosyl-L-methionine-dependent methyltransferase [Pluteus cervinus]|uniref:S-adenosyl-L-methionine-dependent methyltransferase n=1 Tax=Pluteus cervinus TaxID=181527 RepID=A0ACD3B645_9AGAR|nr:S-adenosyl-L-methionine-dependent methyltransferase [Pluteus cervinus]